MLDQDVLSLASSNPTDSILLPPSSQKEADVVKEAEGRMCTFSLPAPHRGNCWTSCSSTTRLYLKTRSCACGRLDEDIFAFPP